MCPSTASATSSGQAEKRNVCSWADSSPLDTTVADPKQTSSCGLLLPKLRATDSQQKTGQLTVFRLDGMCPA
jgi:hypothetical protein